MTTRVRQFITIITLSIAQKFSLAHGLFPALGTELSRAEIFGIAAVRTLMRLFFYPAAALFGFTHHLPSLAATAYIHTFIGKQATVKQKIFFALVPFTCMVTFVLHPVGSQAWAYSLLWIVPMLTAWYAPRTVFVHALGATLTAHAVGSVLFLLCTPMTPLFWLALIPRVLVERGVFALGITGTVLALRALSHSYTAQPA